jgi:hypothetical protein
VPRHALRNHRQRPKKFGLILCMASSIRPILSRPRLRELMASSSVPFVASVARCPRRAFCVANSSLRAFPTSACSILSRLEPADWPVPADVAGVSTLGLVTVRGETGACALPGAASLGIVVVLVDVAVLVVVAAAFCAGCQLERVIDACADDPDTRNARMLATSRVFM